MKRTGGVPSHLYRRTLLQPPTAREYRAAAEIWAREARMNQAEGRPDNATRDAIARHNRAAWRAGKLSRCHHYYYGAAGECRT